MLGETLDEIGFTEEVVPPYVSVKEAVFPFTKFREFDPVLGPEMRSTGEVMGISDSFGSAFAKAQLAADNALPLSGAIFLTVNDNDKSTVTPIARSFHEMQFTLYATDGTARHLRGRGIPARTVRKIHEGRPNGIDLMVNRDIQLLINTPLGKHAQYDDYTLRQTAIAQRVSYTTTMSAAAAAVNAILSLRSRRPSVRALQEWHEDLRREGQGTGDDGARKEEGGRRKEGAPDGGDASPVSRHASRANEARP
jgi:carbamoyl-phosphate synthase large subunit